ncbi:aldo/keto reductase [Pseudomonas cichorii]|uniref:Oxidoreductase n=1 Tax=Pseudomonas cichorii TaxID=36746 RepID=A0A3M4WBK6_PSECI|nr:aldo/keto reductase [Pseudomonas cichorii]RMR60989.1 Oxidoreductase [Pseudomonas cichorii]
MTATAALAPDTFLLGGDTPIKRMGYGAMHLTGYGMWGPAENTEQAKALLRHAVHDLGVTFLDTADSYGPGNNEDIIRDALYPYPENLIISTKGGMLRSGPNDWIHGAPGAPYIVPLGRPEYLRQQVEMSLRRLQVERIDLYQLHSIDPQVPLAESLGELVRLREQGKILHIGLSNQPGVTLEQLEQAHRVANIAAIENLYNIADRTDEPVLQRAQALNIAFIPWFPLGHGALVGPDSALQPLASHYGLTPSQLALAWLLNHAPNIVLIPGTTSIAHLEENAKAVSVQLDEDQRSAIVREVDSLSLPTWRPER